jgi:uncharacterized lipoprotein YajG
MLLRKLALVPLAAVVLLVGCKSTSNRVAYTTQPVAVVPAQPPCATAVAPVPVAPPPCATAAPVPPPPGFVR